MTTVDAMRQFLCYIKNDGSTISDISQDNVADLWEQIGIEFNTRFNSNSGSESGGATGTTGELGELTLVSSPGTTVGMTAIVVTGAESTNFKYAVESGIPSYHEELSLWTDWDGISEIAVEDGAHICVAEVDATERALKAGFVTASINLG